MVCESICEITDSRVGAYPHTLKSGLRPPAGAYPHTKISVGAQSYPDPHLFGIRLGVPKPLIPLHERVFIPQDPFSSRHVDMYHGLERFD